jgi:2-hydroxy-3-keto-5-methylthiopentenyl-1-phosphate phosphatase
MPAIGAVIVDFDGTVSMHDIGVDLLRRFGDPTAGKHLAELDAAFVAGTIGLRTLMEAEAGSLVGSREELIAFALAHCPLDPTFAPFVSWAKANALPITIVSDGFGVHVRPLLAAAGLNDLPVVTNDLEEGRLSFGGPHPVCVGCGTCKKLAVEHARADHGPVAFVGDGVSDRFGARYADVVFAKDGLASYCRAESIPFLAYRDFDDVRRALTSSAEIPGSVGGEPCPGWREPA